MFAFHPTIKLLLNIAARTAYLKACLLLTVKELKLSDSLYIVIPQFRVKEDRGSSKTPGMPLRYSKQAVDQT